MSEDFTSKIRNPELENAISQARTSGELRELMLQELARQGQIVRTRDEFDIRQGPRAGASETQPAAQPVAEPQSDTLLRRAVRLDNGTVRLVEAFSVSGLDILERALKNGQV